MSVPEDSAAPWRGVVGELETRLAPHGLDLVHPFCIAWYNRAVEPHLALPDLGRPDALGVLIASTRSLWPRFMEARAEDAGLSADENPLDTFVTRTVHAELEGLDARVEARFAHDPPPRRIAMQRLAALSGFAPLSPGMLVCHATYGPWIALRAALTVDLPGPGGPAPRVSAPCQGCLAPCKPPFEHALSVADARADPARLHERWRPWLAVRDSCPVGREHRYSEPQILYHYARRWS